MRPERPLSARERLAWLRLSRTPRVGPLTFQRLLARFRDAEAALEALPRLGRTRFEPWPRDAAERELASLERLGARLLAACEPDYPRLLKSLSCPPPVIALRGDLRLLEKPTVALVGAREASAAGLKLAEDLARGLGEAGVTVVSGLARGVDAAAHRASLASGTVAVLAGGLAHPYPPQNLGLHEEIVARGVVVSEAPVGVVARGRDFPRRNHIISGLSLGVVVVEAALRSGSLITARAAAEQGREVMAAPGSPLDPRARGGNALLKEGAALIESAEDILAHIRAAPRALRVDPTPPLFEEEAETAPDAAMLDRVAALLSPTPVHLNTLARLTGAGASALAAAVMELELDGRAVSLTGGYVVSQPAALGGSYASD